VATVNDLSEKHRVECEALKERQNVMEVQLEKKKQAPQAKKKNST